MPAFEVDTMEILRAAKQVKGQCERVADIVSSLQDAVAAAPATGDATCAAAYAMCVTQWGEEMAAGMLGAMHLVQNLVYANNDYVNIESGLAGLPVHTVRLEEL